MNLKYIMGGVLSIPLLPIIYLQGKRIRREIPVLPEAEGLEGFIDVDEEEELKLLFIGESTFAGVGVKHNDEGFCGTFAKTLARKLKVNIQWNLYAKSGYTVSRVNRKIIPKIKEKEVHLVIVGMGGNDAFTLNSPKKWKAQIQTLIESIKNKYPDIPIVFVNMPPIKIFPAFTKPIKFVIGNLVEILGMELDRVVKGIENVHYIKEKITLKEWAARFGLDPDENIYFSDGVHPSKLTYQVWAKDAVNYIINHKII